MKNDTIPVIFYHVGSNDFHNGEIIDKDDKLNLVKVKYTNNKQTCITHVKLSNTIPTILCLHPDECTDMIPPFKYDG